jgi:hypothetical protein
MMSENTILYPVRINSPSPIQTIHRRVGQQLQNQFEFVSFIGEEFKQRNNFVSNLVPINSRWSNTRKFLQLIKLYAADYDIIHTGMAGIKCHPYLVSLATKRGVKHVHTHHSATPKNYYGQRYLSESADIVVAVSEFVANWATDTLRYIM